MRPARAALAVTVGAAVAGLSRATGRGEGSVIGGRATLAIDPGALARMAKGRTIVLVSGTNGKTTTTRLITSALSGAATSGAPGFPGARPVVSNYHGANMPAGLVAALSGSDPSTPAVLEVDEACLADVARQVAPAVVVLLNLSRDQLDRHHEVRRMAEKWARLCSELSPATAVNANADDPLVAWAASHAPRVSWVAAGVPWRSDAAGCPRCAGSLVYDEPEAGPGRTGSAGPAAATSAATVNWHCGQCGLSRPVPDVWLDEEEGGAVCRDFRQTQGSGHGARPTGGTTVAHWRSGRSVAFSVSLPGRCNRSNALMALAAANELGAPLDGAAQGLATVSEVEGRYASVRYGAGTGRLLLAKNPAGWLDALDMLGPAPAPVVVAINARTADGKDPSWLWDVPFELLEGRPVMATGERALDLSVRLHYAGVAHRVQPDLAQAMVDMGDTRFDVVANYTTFAQLRTAKP